MARIRCANCGGVHASAAEVRACYARGVVQPALDLGLTEPDRAVPLGNPPEAGRSTERPTERPTERRSERPGRSPASRRPAGDDPSAAESSAPAGRSIAEWAGPDSLGRSLVVGPGVDVPQPWSGALWVTIDGRALAEPAPVVQALWPHWHGRRRVVFELADHVVQALDPDHRPATSAPEAELWELDPTLLVYGDVLHHLVWANSVDARQPDRPRWRWAEAAVKAGARLTPAGDSDIVLPGGATAWCDGGPIGLLDVPVVHRISLERGSLDLLGSATEPAGHLPGRAGLAADQLSAVTHQGGAARIIAPAGSGKTRVLTERARLLLDDWRLPGSAVCLVAFNKRAADEMVERTPDLRGLQVRTLNALGLAILDGRAPFRRRTNRRHEVLDERQVRRILDGLVEVPRSKRRTNTDPMAPWIDALSAVRLGLQDPADVEDDLAGDVDGLVEVVPKYREALAQHHQLDFDEQIVSAIEVLLREPETRYAAQRACRLMLVDEFQDLTPAHLLLVRLLASPDLAVFGVGDDDQTIYGYTGATPEWLIGYTELFPGSGDHPLQVNYRCPPAVVEAADRLLQRNRRRVPKGVRARPDRPTAADDLTVVRTENVLSASVDAVSRALEEGAEPEQIAVLSRVNASLAPVQIALAHAGIPVRPAVDEGWLARTGVRAALGWLRLATHSRALRAADIADTARRPGRGLSVKVVEWMAEQRTLDGLERLGTRLRDRDSDKIQAYVADIRMLVGVAARGTTADVLRAVRDRIGLDEAMELLDSSKRSVKGSAQTDDLDALVAVAALQPDPGEFEAWLRQQLSARATMPADAEKAHGVMLSSVHAVKGREWPYVVVHEASAGLFPHRLADDVEEERRVFHVAITRAQRRCTVVCGEAPSPFAAELASDLPASDLPASDLPASDPPAHEGSEPKGPIVSRGRRSPDTEPRRPESLANAGSRPGNARPDSRSGRRDRGTKVPAALDAKGEVLRAALKAWRAERARRDGVPAYVVFNDETLGLIAAAGPRSAVALSRLKGIGPAKLDRYGDEVLAVVEELDSPS